MNIKEMWDTKGEIISTTKTKLKANRRTKRKEWITEEIVDLIEERRQQKNRNNTKYLETNTEEDKRGKRPVAAQ